MFYVFAALKDKRKSPTALILNAEGLKMYEEYLVNSKVYL
jgi:hypothetical protein